MLWHQQTGAQHHSDARQDVGAGHDPGVFHHMGPVQPTLPTYLDTVVLMTKLSDPIFQNDVHCTKGPGGLKTAIFVKNSMVEGKRKLE